ncbi:alanine racemase [Henriciella barbarensis]|nr:alanine racemase [Henriciella barbarensis]
MSFSPRARVHLQNIVANWRTIASLVSQSEAGAVVKANAYGHGVAPVARALHAAGCKTFFVAYVDEGVELRNAIGAEATILAFNGAEPGDADLIRTHQITPVLNALPAIREWLKLSDTPSYAVHVDTGMNRLGVRMEDVPELEDLTASGPPVHVMSHLVDSDDRSRAINAEQLARFKDAASHFPHAHTSFANTGGCFMGQDYGFDIVRPGIGLYGGGPPLPDGIELKPGMTLEAPILTVQSVQPGETVGYGATYTFDTPRTLATVALGYGDGFLRAAGNKGIASLGGIVCPIVGRVSMDLITIDVTQAADLAMPGAFAQFIGAEILLEEQARRAGTVGYELVTGLGHRVRRIYD